MKTLNARSFFLLLSFILICFIYYPVLSSSVIIDNDFNIVIAPLTKIHSFSNYWLAIKNNHIFDIQPIRDISLLAAIKFSTLFNFSKTILYYNFILWLVCLILLYKALLRFNYSSWHSSFITALLGIHPAFTQTIPWLSAHKHILSFFFILLSLNYFLKAWKEVHLKKRDHIFCILFFTLSILSQPITITFPIWLAIYVFLSKNYKETPRFWYKTLGIMMIVMICGMAINYWYYSGPYIISTSSLKFIPLGLTERLLSLGRYFMQIVWPISFARNYYYGSTLNLVGLLLLPIAFMIFNKFLGWKKTVIWGSLFFLPLLMVNVRMTNIFVSDTYLLLPSVGLILLLYTTAKKIIIKIPLPKHFYITSYIFLMLILTIQARVEARHWIEPMTFIKVAYEREKSCLNLLNYATYLWRIPSMREEATKRSNEIIVNNCQFASMPSTFFAEARNAVVAGIYFSEDLTNEAKLRILKQSHNPYAKLFIANIYLKTDKNALALKMIDEVLSTTNYVFLDIEKDPALNELNKYCAKKGQSVCERIDIYLDKIKSASSTQARNEPGTQEVLTHPNN